MSQSPSGLSRRTLFAGAGTAGALAAVVSLSATPQAIPEAQTAEPKPPPEKGGGYSLSEHVKRYYRTTRV
ncbi:MAG: formate dehydrogenase [Burkholderiales bacterium PBB4]|nr:MAG: formate dehydrogenase [Burkholderiales bacterium PBB4]